MAFRPIFRQRGVVPAVAAAAAAGLLLPQSVHAETPEEIRRKPIYDDIPLAFPPSTAVSTTPVPADTTAPAPTTPGVSLATDRALAVISPPASPSPTDRLASQIRLARLALYTRAAAVEDSINASLTRALALEQSFTNTVASLAPPKESGEELGPGLLYTVVSGMAGSIVTRNRNVLLRGTVPVLVAFGCAKLVLPITTRNVGDLVWEYEKKWPVLADTHVRAQERVNRFVQTGVAHSKMSVGMLEDKIGSVRESLEQWVSKGR